MTDTHSPATEISTDIVIFGGGIAGLWILNQLHSQGYSVLLLEAESLGNGQSIASQGIIHGGLKYALDGSLSGAATAIAGMPARWRRCLAGNDPVNLSGCRVLSDRYYMWSEGSFRSRLKAFLGSRTLRGKVDVVDEADFPIPLREAKGQGSLYELPDFVIDTFSLLDTLASHHRQCIYRYTPTRLEIQPAGADGYRHLRIGSVNGSLVAKTQRIILAAGEGNAALLKQVELAGPQMQTRPLNMVMLRKPNLPKLFLHCIGDSFSLTPRLTLTSHPCRNGDVAWYLGGELAEIGTGRNDSEQIASARQLLQELFPWVDLDGASWACLRINRAEGREPGRHRPDSVFLKASGDFLIAWPTKFTLSPALADGILAELTKQGILPALQFDPAVAAAVLNSATVASPPWETSFA